MTTRINKSEVKAINRQDQGVGFQNNPVVDPTVNVLRLVESEVIRLNDLQAAETRRVDDLQELRSEFEDKLAAAESRRIDALRAVDVNAVGVANEKSTAQASVLANQVSTSADALRILVASTAATMAAQTKGITDQFTDRLAALEKAQYENKGKSGLVDPMINELTNEVKVLREGKATSTGTVQGISSSWAILLAVIGLAALLLGMWNNLKPRASEPVSPAIIQSGK